MSHRPTIFVFLAGCLGLAACAPGTATIPEGIGFRQARFEEISAMRAFRSCRDEGLELDRQASQGGKPGAYLAAARVLEKCEQDLGPNARTVAVEERMRAYAVGIADTLKGGDAAQARQMLANFKTTFTGSDLYWPDGSSFVDSMELLLGQQPENAAGSLAANNAAPGLRSELRRIYYWARN